MKDKYILYTIFKPLICIIVKVFLHPKVIGKNNIPESGAYILAGNHINNLDCFLLISTNRRELHFFSKKELFKFPLSIIFSHMGLISVDRSKKNPEALDEAYKYLDNNNVITIFPEGTTEKGRGQLPFKMGAVKMSYEKKVPIVPFKITGKYSLFNNDLKIEYGKSFIVKENNLEKYNDKLYNIIKKM